MGRKTTSWALPACAHGTPRPPREVGAPRPAPAPRAPSQRAPTELPPPPPQAPSCAPGEGEALPGRGGRRADRAQERGDSQAPPRASLNQRLLPPSQPFIRASLPTPSRGPKCPGPPCRLAPTQKQPPPPNTRASDEGVRGARRPQPSPPRLSPAVTHQAAFSPGPSDPCVPLAQGALTPGPPWVGPPLPAPRRAGADPPRGPLGGSHEGAVLWGSPTGPGLCSDQTRRGLAAAAPSSRPQTRGLQSQGRSEACTPLAALPLPHAQGAAVWTGRVDGAQEGAAEAPQARDPHGDPSWKMRSQRTGPLRLGGALFLAHVHLSRGLGRPQGGGWLGPQAHRSQSGGGRPWTAVRRPPRAAPLRGPPRC